MKLAYKLSIVFLIFLFVLFCLYKSNTDINKGTVFDVNIKEKLIFKFTGKNELYTYDFKQSEFKLFTGNNNLIPIEYKWNTSEKIFIMSNIYLYDGELYINGKSELKCEMRTCPYYLDKSSRYIILIDRKVYRNFFIKKLLAQHIFKIFDLKTGRYMENQSLKYLGKDVYNFDMKGYVE